MGNLLSALMQNDQAARQNFRGGMAHLRDALERRRQNNLMKEWQAWPDKTLEGAKQFVVVKGIRPDEAQQFLSLGQTMQQMEDITRQRKMITTPLDILTGQTGTRATLPPEQAGPVRPGMFGEFGALTPEQMAAIGLKGKDVLPEAEDLKTTLTNRVLSGEITTDDLSDIQRKILGVYIPADKPKGAKESTLDEILSGKVTEDNLSDIQEKALGVYIPPPSPPSATEQRTTDKAVMDAEQTIMGTGMKGNDVLKVQPQIDFFNKYSDKGYMYEVQKVIRNNYFDTWQIVKVPKPATPEEAGKRERAKQILQEKNHPVTEANIKYIMDQL